MSVTLRFQTTGLVPGDGAPVTMRGPSLTIGRGQGCDMVLPDPDRMVSSTHAVIENQNGNVVIVDLSTNGTFLNYGKIPLGKTPTPLNSGDVLTMGPYELVVDVARARETIADPVADDPVGFGDAGRAPDPHDLLDSPVPGGDFLDDLLGGGAPTGPGQLKTEPEDPFDQLLAPLGEEEDPFFGARDPLHDGPAQADHSSAPTDAFRPASRRADVIPDDWDDLLGPPDDAPRPDPPSAAPAPTATPPRAENPGDDDDPFGLGGPAPGSEPQEEPPAHSPATAPAPAPGAADDPFAEETGLPKRPAPPRPAHGHPAQGRTAPAVPPEDRAGTERRVEPTRDEAAPSPSALAGPASATRKDAPSSDAASGAASDAPPGDAPPRDVPPGNVPTDTTPPDTPASSDAARAFLRALGADEIVSDADLPTTMVRLGSVLKAMITGIREVLMTRTHFKGEFRIDQTMIAANGNNPLKFSITPEQAIEAMAKKGAKGYLAPQEATEQALSDIRAHEVAMVTGMEAALKGVLRKLDPKVLEEKLSRRGGAGLFSNKKAKYWELYEEMYAEIADQAENQFHDLFAREFAAAYKAQLERLR